MAEKANFIKYPVATGTYAIWKVEMTRSIKYPVAASISIWMVEKTNSIKYPVAVSMPDGGRKGKFHEASCST